MQKTQYSMKRKIIRVLLLCWLIPFCCLFGVFGVYLASNHSDATASSYERQLEFNNRICIERLDDAVNASRQASYDGEILKYRFAYRHNGMSYDESQKSYLSYLNRTYQNHDSVKAVVLYLKEGENIQTSTTYNESGGGSFQQIRTYWDEDHREVMEFAQNLGTKIGFFSKDHKIYLVRNLVDNHYEEQGILVLLLNADYCFDSIFHYPLQNSLLLRINDAIVVNTAEEEDDFERAVRVIPEKGTEWIGGMLWLSDAERGDSYKISTMMKMAPTVNRFPFYNYPFLVIGMVVSLILMLWIILLIFRKEVTEPIQQLTEGLHRIENGEIGYQVENVPRNKEFAYLTNVVNEMSSHLKAQVIKTYKEEIALREARIMALQSHINPHFINNTMEIINWEARLGGNEKVSNMIEALSTMMDAAMDRRKRPEITLEEEMGYVSSYFYIMRERLGKRLNVEIDIREELMDCMVPRLILQPVIENAIEHGVVPSGSGTVRLTGYQKEDFLYLEIWNDGSMTEEDRERIQRLLDPEYNTSKEPSGNLGIANVNQRLRILFGVPCGLTIEGEEGKICARLTIPYHNLHKINQEMTP